jgi:hypothetical protein
VVVRGFRNGAVVGRYTECYIGWESLRYGPMGREGYRRRGTRDRSHKWASAVVMTMDRRGQQTAKRAGTRRRGGGERGRGWLAYNSWVVFYTIRLRQGRL